MALSSEEKIREKLEDALAARNPERTRLRLTDLFRISDGWETEVFSFAVEYVEEATLKREELILRIYPGNDAAEKSVREFEGLRQLYTSGYPVPQISFIETNTAVLGQPFVVMEKIDGNSLGIALRESPPERRTELGTLFCRLFADLHRLDWHPFTADSFLTENPDQCVVQEINRWLEYVHQLGREEFDPLFNWLLKNAPRTDRLSVLHWDFHPFNILLRPDGTPSVIDWGNIQVSDFRFDLAWSLLLTSTYGDPSARDRLLTGYERATDEKVEQIEFFDAAASFRRLGSILLSLSAGSENMGMRPGAEKMMLAQPEHIRSVYVLLVERTGIRIPEAEKLLATIPD
jgi:aminoglycoside phosphotransferase (APT) family kinase protein